MNNDTGSCLTIQGKFVYVYDLTEPQSVVVKP